MNEILPVNLACSPFPMATSEQEISPVKEASVENDLFTIIIYSRSVGRVNDRIKGVTDRIKLLIYIAQLLASCPSFPS